MSSTAVAQSVRAGFSGRAANGDQQLYQGGAFIHITERPFALSGEFLIGQAKLDDFAEEPTSNRIDFGGKIHYNLLREGEVSLSCFGGLIYRKFKFEREPPDVTDEPVSIAERDDTGVIVGFSFAGAPVGASIGSVRLDGERYIIPAVSFAMPVGGGWGISLGYRGEIRRGDADKWNYPTIHGIIINLRLPG